MSRILSSLVMLFMFAGAVWAAETGAISGTVTDRSGAVLSGASVSAENTTTRFKTIANGKGFFTFRGLPAGTYDVTIEHPGFAPSMQTGMVLKNNGKVETNVKLAMLLSQGQRGQPTPPAQQAPPMNMPMPATGGPTPQLDVPVDNTDPKALLDRIKVLETRVVELESNAVLSEPEMRVQKIEVYVDPNGVVSDTPVPGSRKVTTYQRERTYRRQTISEKIEEAMDDAASHSVEIGVDAATVIQFAPQTSGPISPARRRAYELASADLFFTAGLAQNTIFYADIVGLSGAPPDGETGGMTLVNGYAARLGTQNQLNLREAWMKTELFSNRLGLTAGRLDLTNYFDNNTAANDETTQFISDALVNNQVLGLGSNGAGVAVVFDPKMGLNFKVGIQQSNDAATNLSNSLFSLAEIGYLATPFSLGEGNYRVWYRTDNSAGGYATGYGVSLDQKLAAPVTLFGRYGSAQAGGGTRNHFYSGGLQFQNGATISPGDQWGVGYAHFDAATEDKERLVEYFYNFSLTEKLRLSFHLTHILEKPVGAPSFGFLIPGVRLQAAF